MRILIRKLLNKAGYDIVKINVHSISKAHITKSVKVGKFMIDMPGHNSQLSTYKYNPDANNLLGKLTLCVAAKYPGFTAIDIGANVGDTIAVIKSVLDIPIIGIEGDDISFRYLQKNSAQFADVTILKQFLGDKKQTIAVDLEKAGWNTTLIPSTDKGAQVSLKTLDQVLEENQLASQNIKILKVDTEGFDTIIIRGAADVLQNNKPVVFFEYNKTNMNAINEDGLSTLLSLEKFGYRSVLFFDNYGRFMLSTGIDQEALIKHLHNYTEDTISRIGYYDVCLFHDRDTDLRDAFIHEVTPK